MTITNLYLVTTDTTGAALYEARYARLTPEVAAAAAASGMTLHEVEDDLL
jgi:hypothetical protein